MYEHHWHLNRRPFDDVSSPDFYVPIESHQATLLKLRYLVEQHKGVGVVVGEHGLGKTYLTQVLEQQLRNEGQGDVLRLVIPQLQPRELCAYFAARLGAKVTARDSQDVVLQALESQLAQRREQNVHTMLLIDDAHLLSIDHLQALRLLLNLRQSQGADFTMILIGRTELLSQLSRLAALQQRMTVKAALEPLSVGEVATYLAGRLKASGRTEHLFSDDAAQAIWEISQGIPRRINQLADLALLVGFADTLHQLGAVEIEAAAQELLSVAA